MDQSRYPLGQLSLEKSILISRLLMMINKHIFKAKAGVQLIHACIRSVEVNLFMHALQHTYRITIKVNSYALAQCLQKALTHVPIALIYFSNEVVHLDVCASSDPAMHTYTHTETFKHTQECAPSLCSQHSHWCKYVDL